MANEVKWRHTTTGKTLYYTIRNASGQMWNTDTDGPAFETLTVANWYNASTSAANYWIAMTETPGSSYFYVGTWPATLSTAGWYYVDIYIRKGANPAIGDSIAATLLVYWNGTTANPWSSDTVQVAGTVQTAGDVGAIQTVTDKLDTALELDTAVYRFTANALEEAPVGEGGAADWTADEKEQIRDALGVDGDKTTAANGQLQDITATLGTPADIDSGGATIADNLKKLADDNGGLTFDATADSLNKIKATLGTPANIDSGGATIADNLKKLADDNGGASFDATTNSLNKLTTTVVSGVASAINAGSQTYTTDASANRAGDYSYTYLSNGTYWVTAPTTLDGNGNGLDVYLTYTAGATQQINSVSVRGYFLNAAPAGARYVTGWAWNYVTSAWQQITDAANRMAHATSNVSYTWSLTSDHRKSDGEVKIRFTSTSATVGDRLNIDQCVVNVQTAGPSATDIANAVYSKMALVVYDRQVWIDTVAGVDGTTVGVHGLASSPVLTLAAAYTLCADLGLKSIAFKSGSNATGVALSQSAAGWRFVGPATIDLGSQDIEDAIFEDCYDIYGISTGDDAQFNGCGLAGTGALTVDHAYFKYCRLKGEIILIANAEPHDFEYCTDASGAGTQAEITFVENATVLMRVFAGALQINSMGSTNSIVIDGATRIVIDASSTAGEIVVRGFSSAIDGASTFTTLPNTGTITQTARFSTDAVADAVFDEEVTGHTGFLSKLLTVAKFLGLK